MTDTEQTEFQRPRLVVIVGSVRQGRFGSTVARWVADRAHEDGRFGVEVLDIADVDLPLVLPALPPKIAGDDYPRPAGMHAATSALESADAFVIVTPEYNHSFPASLKALIDWHFTQWEAKPVALVSYGGGAGGRHAAAHLESVLTELHAVPLADGLLFPNYFVTWEADAPIDPPVDATRLMLTRLEWWARTLRDARAARPFPQEADLFEPTGPGPE